MEDDVINAMPIYYQMGIQDVGEVDSQHDSVKADRNYVVLIDKLVLKHSPDIYYKCISKIVLP